MEQLKAFVTAQGLDWDELTEPLPHLEAPQISYENKENLMKKAVTVPLFAKIISAAAAIALLLAIFWKQDESLPKMELVAELQPKAATTLASGENSYPSPTKKNYQIQYQQIEVKRTATFNKIERTEAPLLADLSPHPTSEIQLTADYQIAHNLLPEPVLYRFDATLAQNEIPEDFDYDWNPSLFDKAVIYLSEGKYSSLGQMLSGSLKSAKREVVKTASEFVATAYYKMDYNLEEAKERWQEKRERWEDE